MLFSPNCVKVSGMDFTEFLEKYARIIDLRLEEVLGESSTLVNKASPELKKIFDEFANSSRGGKRIRGALVLLGYQIGGGREVEKVVDGAVAFEIFQTSILAQDDVIDKSITRRAKPSLYSALGGDGRAIAQAICLSDLGFFNAYRLFSNLKIEDALKVKAINFFSQTLSQTVLGEMLDIETPFLQREFQDEDALRIALLKTARYTISGPLMMGALLAGAPAEKLKQLQVFGDNLGIGFQIQDDILGVFGDEKVTGKSSISDIKECKATLLIAFAQKKGNEKQKEILEKYYGDKEIGETEAEEVRTVFKETGSLGYAKLQAEKYFSKACESLKGVEEGLLYSLVKYVQERKA